MLSVSGCITKEDTDYRGNDVGDSIKLESQQACAEHCASVEGGLFWTYSYSTNLSGAPATPQKVKRFESAHWCAGNSSLHCWETTTPRGVSFCASPQARVPETASSRYLSPASVLLMWQRLVL